MTIANQIARQKLAKGVAITDKHLAQQALQTKMIQFSLKRNLPTRSLHAA
ncbi:hypothetical protein ACSZM6_18975 [Aeromonas caviae]